MNSASLVLHGRGATLLGVLSLMLCVGCGPADVPLNSANASLDSVLVQWNEATRPQWVKVRNDRGYARFEGDIVLGRLDTLKANLLGTIRGDYHTRWPMGRIPYVIDPSFPMPQNVDAAIQMWNASSLERPQFYQWDHQYPDYVRIVGRAGVCQTPVGRAGGGEQLLEIDPVGCPPGHIAHELGHTIGLYHEQTRPDRDSYVTYHPENVQNPLMKDNFTIRWDAVPVEDYDWGSLMHYSETEFAKPGTKTLECRKPCGQRLGPSPGDYTAVANIVHDAGWGAWVCGNTRTNRVDFWWARGKIDAFIGPPNSSWYPGMWRRVPAKATVRFEQNITVQIGLATRVQTDVVIGFDGRAVFHVSMDGSPELQQLNINHTSTESCP
jgi:Astacin (Peptidase family M12A)